MQKHLSALALTFIALALCHTPASGAISITDTGSQNGQINGGATLANITLSSSVNTAVFVLFSTDNDSAFAATFAGEAMTVVQTSSARAVLAYIANPMNLSGNLVVNPGGTGSGDEIAYWGVASGIDTSSIQVSDGSSIGSGNQTINNFTSLDSGDFVYSIFGINNQSGTAYTGGLVALDGSGSAHDAIITTNTITSSGSFTPTVPFGGSANGSQVGASIAFTAIPEPSAALLGSIGAIMLLRRRRQ